MDVEITVELIHQTHRAILINDGEEGKNIWIPKSQLRNDENEVLNWEVGEIIIIILPEWLAMEKELI